jgi:ribosomal protein L44E
LPPVTCPGCRVRMAPAVVNSLPADRIDVTYRCEKCGFETDRVIRVRSH